MYIGFSVIKPHLLTRVPNVKAEIKLSNLFVSFLILNTCKF